MSKVKNRVLPLYTGRIDVWLHIKYFLLKKESPLPPPQDSCISTCTVSVAKDSSNNA